MAQDSLPPRARFPRALVLAVTTGLVGVAAGAAVVVAGGRGTGACAATGAHLGGAGSCLSSALTLVVGLAIAVAGLALIVLGSARGRRSTRLERRGEYRSVPRSWAPTTYVVGSPRSEVRTGTGRPPGGPSLS
ncbi:MAG TPA: hypothetical protein PLS29_02110 [Acidimicrobiales bacterium]|nr:hypothetical protein [Acidimicrobiales bacterium]